MWKYYTKKHSKEFILSLNLITNNISDELKLNILYAISNNSKKYYTQKYIMKKNGTKRLLLIPNKCLKNIQKNILKNILNNLSVSPYVKSYLPNTSIKENAISHQNKKIILKLDIKDFFSSIDFEMLYKVLPNEIFPPNIKVLILKLCTYDDYLPQGAPTSPMLSNLALKNFDNYIGDFCTNNNISYTRYCDDLTFSGTFSPEKIINKVRSFLEEFGLNLNMSKTKIIPFYKSQQVTGLTVNKKINIPKKYYKKIRQEMYYINKYGLENHLKYLNINDNKYLNKLLGRINYSLSISPNKELKEYQNTLKKYIKSL